MDQFRRGREAVDKLVSSAGWTGEDGKVKRLAPDVACMIKTLAWTDMRRGELLALRWTDLVDGELFVQRSVWKGQEKSTKTDDPRRVTVVEPLAQVLADQRRWLLERQHPGLASGLIYQPEQGLL